MEQKRRILLRRRNLDSAFGRPRVPAIARVRSTAVRSGSGIAERVTCEGVQVATSEQA